MRKEAHSWHSPALGITMPIVCYGHFGFPILMFPTAAADCEEYERFGLVGAVAHHVEAGKVKLYSINSINRYSWMNDQVHPMERARRQALYDAYVYQEVAPFIGDHCRTPGIAIGTTGASFGAFHSLNTLLKHPDRFKLTMAMSGAYDLRTYADGYYDENIYFNNPVDYLPNLNDHNILEQLRQTRIYIMTGQGSYEAPQHSKRVSQLLWDKGVSNQLDLWGYEWSHDWPTWRVMLNHYIGTIF
ncbi:MAG TPA: alpha/beta hydrolase-fold protein [Acidobacteriota bacterium]|nr:alpha/beta hydrolase-fold protein [Acidobacteriota bacterium]